MEKEELRVDFWHRLKTILSPYAKKGEIGSIEGKITDYGITIPTLINLIPTMEDEFDVEIDISIEFQVIKTFDDLINHLMVCPVTVQ